MKIASFALGTAALAFLVGAQFPTTPSGLRVVTSKVSEEVKISYKEVSGSPSNPLR